MARILISVTEPYSGSERGLKPGNYVNVHICRQVDFYDQEITQDTPFRPAYTFSPVEVGQLRSYLFGLQHMSKITCKDDEVTVEVSKELLPALLGIDNMRETTIEI